MKTITHFKWVHRRTMSLLMYVFIFMFSGLMHAQTLKTDNDVPALSACGDYEEFTLRIGYGVNPCPNASLEIVMPDHILYEVGSAKLGGVPLTESGATEAGATVTFPIPAGAVSDELTITFNAKATCEAIATANLPIDQRPAVTYNLSGCGAATLTGDSEAINIRFAVLNLTINPLATQGVVGDSFTRTVTLQNSGNGYINEFTIVSDPGDDLAVTSTMPATVDGWTVTETTPGTYVFSGSTLAPGATVSFDETVEMTSCGSINTIYEAYYGCTDRCTISNVDDTKTAVITVDNSRRPVLQRSVERVDGNYRCFDEDYTVVWKITNTGTATATGIQLRFGAHYYSNNDGYGSTHVVLGAGYEMADDPDFTTNVTTLGLGAAQLIGPVYGNRFGTTGLPAYQNFTFPNDIAPGQTVYIRYTQRNNSPVVSCEDQTYRILYGSIVGHSGESFYKNADACDPDANIYNVGGTVEYRRNGNTTLNGSNVGSLEASDGTPFSGKFRITNFFAENTGNQFFAPGDYIDIVLEVSPSLAAGLSNAVLSGGTSSNPLPVAVPDGPGKVRFRFEFGTPTWPIGNLSQSLMFLDFNSIMVCPGPSWYKVSYEVNRLACGDSYVQKCHTYNITTFCGPCEEGGLSNSTATVTRLTYGAVAQNPDNQGKPQFPLVTVDPETSAVPIQTSFFMAGDVVEISQVGISKVTGLSPVTEWTAGHFGFTVPNNNLDAGVVPNSGKMVITRGADTYTITGLPVSMSGLVAGMDFDMALLHANGLPATFTGFQDSDQLVSSIQIIANSAWTSTEAAINFATTYHFIHNSSNYACAPGWRATGIMGRLALDLYRGGGDVQRNLTNCGQQPNYARFDVAINGSVNRNVLFTNEYRQFIFPKKLIMTVPAGLSVDRVQASIYEQGYSPSPRAEIDITPVSGGTVEIELGDHLAAALAESMATIDEGLRIDFNPRTSPTCEATDQVETITMRVEYEAVIPHRQSAGDILLETAGTYQTREAELNYLTDNSKIAAQLINPTVPSTDGTASWVVAVVNSSSFRTFANTWLGGADIVSVQQVTSQAGTTTTGSPLTAIDGVYQIGNLPTMTTRYYRVTANVTGCDDGSIDIAFGHSCDGYPTSVADAACVTHTMEANYTQVVANLQSQIVSQNSASARPLLCEALPYTVMISNSGEGTAFDLLVSIPLTAAEGLAYVPGTLEITPAYSGATVPAFVAAADTNVTVTGGVAPAIIITVPSDIAESLAFGERLQVKFELTSDGCEFRSGQRIGFYPGGINACGTRVANTAGVATNRVIIDGAPEEEPTLTVQTETAEVNITRAVGDPLTAVYNFEFENTGDGVNNFVVDNTYGFNVKLPQGWEFVEDPQTLVDDTLLNFVGLDPVKGYVYEFISDLTVGNAIAITDAEMIYTGDVALLDCEDDLGSIVASVYSVFTPNRDPSCGADPACNIEQVVLTSEVPMALPVLPTPTGEEEQEFCETQGATIADLDIDIDPSEYIIKWYDAETGGNELTDASPLATGTYYVYVALVDGATGCESDRLEVEVTISEDVTADAGADQELVNETSFTMGGNQPTAPATGEWTFVSGIDADGAALTATDVAIADATAYNTTVEIPLGAEVVMQWTVTNGSCEAEDEVTITSASNTINAEDDDFSSIEINNEDGNANVGNVLPDNGNGADTLGSDDATIANVTITVVTPATPATPGANVPEIDPATGIVSVPANTPSGTYEIEYRICETAILPVENCDTAIVTVVVVDACSLEITCPAAVTVECGDSLDAADLGMPAIVSSCGNTTVTYTDSALTGGCSSTTGTFTRTFTVTDENGNEETCTQEITVEDTIAPALTGTAYAGVTGVNACMADAETAAPFNADFAAQGYTDCSGDVTIALVDTNVTGTNCAWTVTYTFTVTDVCGNVLADQSYSNSGSDQTAPALTGAAYAGVTGVNACRANAETAAPFDAALAVEGYTDNCGGDVTATLTGTNVTGTDCEWTVTYTFTITDACGNALTNQSYSNSGSDQTAPTLTGAAYTGVTGVNACMANAATAAPFNAALATQGYTDNCYETVTATLTDTNVTGTDCAWEVTYTFTITDACGNTLENQTYTNSGSDQTAPALTGTGYRGQTGINTCMPTVADAATAFDADAAAQGYTDNCGGDLTITLENTEVTGTNCAWEVTYTFTVTDICGNSLSNQTYRNTGSDQTAPTLTGAAYAGVTGVNACMANAATAAPFNANFAVQGYTDNCGGAVTATLTDTNVTGTDCEWTVTYTFTITDACGNALTNQTYTNSGSDQTAPALTGTPYAGQTGINACTADAVASAPFDAVLAAQGYTDGCGGALTITLDDTEVTGDDCNWTVTYTYSVTDVCGNVLANQSYSNSGGNQGRPVITTNPQHSWTECGSDNAMDNYYAWLNNNGGAIAESACGNDVTWSYWLEDTNTIVGYAGTVTVNFKATDACGNSTIRQATFAFVDTTPPTITQDPTNLVIECSVYGEDELNAWLSNFGNAQAEDTCGQVTWSHNYQGNLEVCGGAITVTFTATDEAGLQSTVTATVEVVDTIAPTLTVVAQPLTVQCGANTDQALNNWLVNHGGAEAIDNCATVTWTNDYDPANFVAACGNTGSVEVTFTGSDSCGNTVTTTATFTIEDTAAPTLVTPAQPQTAECGADAEAALLAWLANNGGATATDSCDADLTWTNDYNDGANFIAACGNTGEVTVTFTAADDCGNSVSTVAKFTIVDTTKPVFDINPQNVEAECDGAGNEAEYEAWLAAYAGAQASDNCGEVTYSYSLVDTAVLCGKTFSRTVRFTATDECGNRVSQQATFTIVDTTAPEFITEPEDVTVECDGAGNINDLNAWLNSYGGATAEDICSTEVKWSNNFRGLTTTCGGAGTAEVTFTATDACGNSSSRTATFTIVDTTSPEFVSDLPASEIFIRCEDLQPAETLKAADNCSDVTVVSYDEIVPSDCGDTKYQIVRTWVATDDCGNETTFIQTIHMSCQIEVFNAVTPNGDGYNDELELKGIECYPGNTVEIFNRWGVMVWSTQDYNSNGNTFNGYSNGRATISQDGMLPSGTYYYIIRYDYDLGNGSVYPIEQAGYLHLETNK